jgi:hypothetical protein
MGKIYMDIVAACLSGQYAKVGQGTEETDSNAKVGQGTDETDSNAKVGQGTGETDSNEQERFYWKVVNPLSKLVA